MTAIEIKTEMHRVIDHIPESVLQQALDLLKELQERSDEDVKFDNNLKIILAEDKELLRRLAQ
jgi:hypothetical protein